MLAIGLYGYLKCHRSAPVIMKHEFQYIPYTSGLNGKALRIKKSDIPTKNEVRRVIPNHCFKRDTITSLKYALFSFAQGASCLLLSAMIPLKIKFLPLWIAYAIITGTVWTGMWVIAHECGHNAFSENMFLQNLVGYAMHSMLLVPYFSWQRSHAVHHSRTNHITEGETHVPYVVEARSGIEIVGGEKVLAIRRYLGNSANGILQLISHMLFGWPLYLLFGMTGGPKYGISNHFVPFKPFDNQMWPGKWRLKVLQSDMGIFMTIFALVMAARYRSPTSIFARYFAPLLVTNMWLVAYTWLQHTDVDVPHLSDAEFSYMRGAFLTIDRSYGKVLDYLHHNIGSTHVAHHIDCRIPHYHAREATLAISNAFPSIYLYDPTPWPIALWRVASQCISVKLDVSTGQYLWVQ